MTDLNPDPFIVSMVQAAATTLPMFLFALQTGAFALVVGLTTATNFYGAAVISLALASL
jgi:hypothetical protein